MAWVKYKEIKLALGGIPTANLSDFPKLVSITTDADIASELSGGGGIKFTSADGVTDLSFGLYPSTNLAAGTVLARVKIGSLLTAASVGDVIARLYYSSSGTTTENKAGVMDGNYALFMPMEEDPSGSAPQMRDWVTDTLLGTSSGMVGSDLVAGQVGNALDYDGAGDYVQVPDAAPLRLTGDMTVEAWVNPTNYTNYNGIVGKTNGANPGYDLYLVQGSGIPRFYLGDGTGLLIQFTDGTTAPSTGVWSLLGCTITGASVVHFLNGSTNGSGSNTQTRADTGTALRIGSRNDSGTQFSGQMDEVRISSVARTSEWLAYSYADDFTNSSTFTLSAEQGGSPAATDAEYGIRTNTPHHLVGPMALRQGWRPQPIRDFTQAPATNTGYGPPSINIPNHRVGPMALRQGWRQPPNFQPDRAPITDANFGIRTDLPHPFVGPMALRQGWRPQPIQDYTQATVTTREFASRINLPHPLVGPPALRRLTRRPFYPFDSTLSSALATNRLRRVICSGA